MSAPLSTHARLGRPLGAPGVYRTTAPPDRRISGVRMDVCAFVGVAPRGPARELDLSDGREADRPWLALGLPRRRTVAVAVESFEEYERRFGGFEGPGLLPYSVASFFEQGGRRAFVSRIVHDDPGGSPDDACASGRLEGFRAGALDVVLRARDEGTWGNDLRADLGLATRPFAAAALGLDRIRVDADSVVEEGRLVRAVAADGSHALAFARGWVRVEDAGAGAPTLEARLDPPVPAAPVSFECVEGSLLVTDGAGRTERHAGVGFGPDHPRSLARVLALESELLLPDASWADRDVLPDDAAFAAREPDVGGALDPAATAPFTGGEDRWHEIVPDDFFESGGGDCDPDDPLASGLCAVLRERDVALVCVPDLYSPAPLVEREPVQDPPSLAGPAFAPCVDVAPPAEEEPPAPGLDGLRLDPAIPAERDRIRDLQLRVVDAVARRRHPIALLDVPPGLEPREILAWRAGFRSAFSAAYHPWLRIARNDDARDALVRVPPSAFAAGIVAARENAHGIAHGPANELAFAAVDADEHVAPAVHDQLHPEGINVFRLERDGVRLHGARTLARDRAWRQISVRRLVSMIARSLEERMAWTVFESNTPALRSEVESLVRGFLLQLFAVGAFRGAIESEAFFVRCDEALNPGSVVDAGRLVCQVGVAPSEPTEFVVVDLVRESDGNLETRSRDA